MITANDGRYTVNLEHDGSPTARYVARFCDERIGAASTERAARRICDAAYINRMHPNLSVKRQRDRDTMAQLVADLADSYGAFTIDRETLATRESRVYIRTLRDLCVGVDFDADCTLAKNDEFLLSWHTSGFRDSSGVWQSDKTMKLNPGFWRSVNECHFRKATDVCNGFADLYCTLSRRFDGIFDGSAFQS